MLNLSFFLQFVKCIPAYINDTFYISFLYFFLTHISTVYSTDTDDYTRNFHSAFQCRIPQKYMEMTQFFSLFLQCLKTNQINALSPVLLIIQQPYTLCKVYATFDLTFPLKSGPKDHPLSYINRWGQLYLCPA